MNLFDYALEMEQPAKSVSDPCQKGILWILASEEQKHTIVLQHIIEFVSRPKQWLEHLMDDYGHIPDRGIPR